jgi:TonB family protein
MDISRFACCMIVVNAALPLLSGGAHGQTRPTAEQQAPRSTDTVAAPAPQPVAFHPDSTYELSRVDELPRLTNARELSRVLASNYPPALRGVTAAGVVTVRMRVLPDGIVDTASITVVSTTDERFNEATIRSVGVLRWRPAKVQGRPVAFWVDFPIRWTVS